MYQRISENGVESSVQGKQELFAEAGDPAVIPIEGLRDIDFGIRPDYQLAVHDRVLILSRTTDQGEPAAGSL